MVFTPYESYGENYFPTIVYVYTDDGKLVDGWPQSIGEVNFGSPALADFDNDGTLEIVIGTDEGLYVFYGNGNLVDGWPVSTPTSDVAIGDVNGDGNPDIVYGSLTEEKLYARNFDGSVLDGWPKMISGTVYYSPAIADLDNDGDVEIVYSTTEDKVYVLDMDAEYDLGTMHWPQFHADEKHTGVWKDPCRDRDGDGFGVCDATKDCNDYNPNIHPGATETCDGVDENCDGSIDEGLPLTTYYYDSDHDTYGDPDLSIEACSRPVWYVALGTDCDDTNPNINPAHVEDCNGVDDNCNGIVDFEDEDNDYFSTCTDTYPDCDDSNPNINAYMPEICDNGLDDDCNGQIDHDQPSCTCMGNNGVCVPYSANYNPCNELLLELKTDSEWWCPGGDLCCGYPGPSDNID